jgi:hypothetical protein
VKALICSEADLDGDLSATMLYRSNVERHVVRSAGEARTAAERLLPEIVLVSRDLEGAAALVKGLRDGKGTRRLSVVALARGDFATSELGLLEAGVNAVLRLPPGGDWDDRLFRLMHVPARRELRVAAQMTVDLGFGATGPSFLALAVNLSMNGLLVETNESLRVGDDVRFRLDLPGGAGAVEGEASVVRHGGPGQHGLEILSVKGDGRVHIKRFVDGL